YQMPPKAKTLHDISCVVVDVGETMGGEVEEAKHTADWIISRKIFTNSSDEVRLIVTGSAEKSEDIDRPNVIDHGGEFLTARFDMLRYLDREVKQGEQKGTITKAMISAIEAIKEESDSRTDIDGRQIVLITNGLSGYDASKGEVESILGEVKNLGIDVVVIGINRDFVRGGITVDMVTRLEKETEATVMTFAEALNGISHFVRPTKAKRGTPFTLEISPEIKIPVKSYVKTKHNPKGNAVKFVHPDGENGEVTRERVYVQVNEVNGEGERRGEPMEVDGEEGEDKKNAIGNGGGVEIVQLERTKLKKGFKFGMTTITLDDAELKMYDGSEFKTGKCLQLVQITKKSTLNPSHLIGADTRIFLIDDKASNSSTNFFLSLAQTCQQEDTVLVVRYAYSVVATPHLLALFPYEEESGNMAWAGVQLAFYEDVRPLQFPPIEDASSKATSHQLKLVDDLIDGMQLSETDGTDIDSEMILQPAYQRICTAARAKALKGENEMDDEEEEDGGEKYLETLRPNKEMLKKMSATIEELKNEERGFELIKKEKLKRPKLERVPENVDDLLEEIEKSKRAALEIKPAKAKKLPFNELAMIMRTKEDMYPLRGQVETMCKAGEDQSNAPFFYTTAYNMLVVMREGSTKDSVLMHLFDELMDDLKDEYPPFAVWMTELSKPVIPFTGTQVDFWGQEMKDFKPNL
ncbi:hypothetical protein PENTCL1PPCAC_26458, partial [Pristionchus entomophagus]